MTEDIDSHFIATLSAMTAPTHRLQHEPATPLRTGSPLTVDNCLTLFDAQLGNRHLDLAARWLRSKGKGYYTIGSSGHEGNVAVAALRP